MCMISIVRLFLALPTASCKGFPDHPEHRWRAAISGIYRNISIGCIRNREPDFSAGWMLPWGGCPQMKRNRLFPIAPVGKALYRRFWEYA